MRFVCRARSVFWLALLASGIALAAPPKSVSTLPMSIADLMRASIEIPADGIWAAEGSEKLSEEEWLLADQDAVNLIAATSLMAKASNGFKKAGIKNALDASAEFLKKSLLFIALITKLT